MFVKKDLRKLKEILQEERQEPLEELRLARREAEFGGGIEALCCDENVEKLEHLKVLSLYSNQLSRVDSIGLLMYSRIRELNLGLNNLSQLPSGVCTTGFTSSG